MLLLDEVGFVTSFNFKYSPRPGTPALRLKGAIDPVIAQERLARYQARQREHSAAWIQGLEGSIQTVLVEGPSRHDEGVISGRTGTGAMINFPGEVGAVGSWMQVRVTRGFTHSGRAEAV